MGQFAALSFQIISNILEEEHGLEPYHKLREQVSIVNIEKLFF